VTTKSKLALSVNTAWPVALDSPDHTHPYGTRLDNSVNPEFNAKLYELIPREKVRLLDLGCAGGGFVKSILDDGGFAVGIEGSDYSRLHKRWEWATIPGNLFTGDITKPFSVTEGAVGVHGGTSVLFNVITIWECLEHLTEEGLHGWAENVRKHLLPGGVVIASISSDTSPHPLFPEVELHQTVRPEWWWKGFLQVRLGFRHRPDLVTHFGEGGYGAWVRDRRTAPGSFHVVLEVT
jgi:2-polyprenyl-3-methyl-5-hydroxy-6-metoxy-1,4-benzoquinol methylase